MARSARNNCQAGISRSPHCRAAGPYRFTSSEFCGLRICVYNSAAWGNFMIIIAGLVILIAALVAEVAGVQFIDRRGLRALAGAAAPSAPGGAEPQNTLGQHPA